MNRTAALVAVVLAACSGPLLPAPATPTPNTGGFLGSQFLWAESGPTSTFGEVDAEAIADAAALPPGASGIGDALHPVTVVGRFETPAQAEAAANELSGEGQVSLMGPIVAVTKDVEDPDGVLPSKASLASRGASVLVEGDRAGEGTIAVDLSCTAPDEAVAADLRTQLADYGSLYHYLWARPPWIDPPPTPAEALARSTFRRWVTAQAEAIQSDPRFLELAHEWAAAMQSGDQARAATARARLDEHVASIVAEPSEPLDPETLAMLVNIPAGTPEESYRWGAELGERMGQLRLAEGASSPRAAPGEDRFSAILTTRSDGRVVDVGYVVFTRFVSGFASLVSWLDRNGCTDLRFGLVDFDLVRG